MELARNNLCPSVRIHLSIHETPKGSRNLTGEHFPFVISLLEGEATYDDSKSFFFLKFFSCLSPVQKRKKGSTSK